MKTISIREAQHHLSKAIKGIEEGEEYVLTKRGKKIAKIIPWEEEKDPLTKKVDWEKEFLRLREELKGLPKLKGNSVLILRELERY